MNITKDIRTALAKDKKPVAVVKWRLEGQYQETVSKKAKITPEK